MPPRRSLDRLIDYQADILAILSDKEPLIADAAARDVAALARARWSLMRALTAYSLFKHNEVFDPMLATATPVDARRLREMKGACLELGDEFRSYVRTWSSSDVEASWHLYRPAAKAMAARIRAHLSRERSAIAALLADPVTPPRAAAPPRPDRPIPAG